MKLRRSTMNIVHKIESFLPQKWVEAWRFYKKYYTKQMEYVRKIKDLRNSNRPICVYFFVLDASVWKYESVYRYMLSDDRFIPKILVCPIKNQSRQYMLDKMNRCYSYFVSNGYDVQKAYDEVNDLYVDASVLEPDIIFFTSPYRSINDDRYYINKLANVLICYCNYSYCNVPLKYSCADIFHQLVWRYYIECDDNLLQVKKFYSAKNSLVTGYPMIDNFINHTPATWPWKLRDMNLKRIIWAPHHTIEGNTDDIAFSTFLEYYDLMLEIAEKYSDQIQIVFKPHSILKPALYKHPKWGVEKTDAYYAKWANGYNTAYEDGDYIDLFLTSDAMIHDCGSFIIEYLYTNKPVMLLDNGIRLSQSNNAGINAYNCHYIGKCRSDILNFVNNLINDNDEKSVLRANYYKKYLLQPYGNSVAENIVNDILEKIYG